VTETTRSGKLGEWQRLKAALQESQTELPELELQMTQFETLVGQAADLFRSQAGLVASKQEASQQLTGVMLECQRLATVLRFSLKQHYGPRSERLTAFGLPPFRGRTPKPSPPPETAEPSTGTSPEPTAALD
jgi:DNA repair exonuclease SbcCD ATPase subunit